MTKREFLMNVIGAIEGKEGVDVVAVRDFAMEQIAKMDERNATRSSKPTKTQLENEAVKEQILAAFEVGEVLVAAAIGERVGISTQKASALCRQLVEVGSLKSHEVKIPKKGKQKAYSIITESEEPETEEQTYSSSRQGSNLVTPFYLQDSLDVLRLRSRL